MIRLPSLPTVPQHSIRAPRGHGQFLIEPSWEQLGVDLQANRVEAAAHRDYDIQGQSLGELSADARRGLLAEARAYTACYRDGPAPGPADGPVVLAGHQPQLFHAGVWFKNFALSWLGRAHRAAAVNLLIDNDIHRLPSLRVPTSAAGQVTMTTLLFDQVTAAIPYEERAILDQATFASFGRRVQDALQGLIDDPLIVQLWPLARDAAQRSGNLGRCLAEARHRLEGEWGQQTWELPLSRVCQTPCFARFTLHLLANLPRLHQVYNDSLTTYRQANRIRSRRHPVPNLEQEGPWREAPFWIWTAQSPQRRRLFVRAAGSRLELTDRQRLHFPLPRYDAEAAVTQWVERQHEGLRLRPRALITTMYARLVLGDLFLHGIGGAKYDQLTDGIIARFFGFPPPRYAVMSATALLFEDRTESLRAEIRGLQQQLRELRFHAEHHVRPSQAAERLAAEKRAWIQTDPPRGQRATRHREIERRNAELQPYLAVDPNQLTHRLNQARSELRQEVQRASREFSFCLFPAEVLQPLLRSAEARVCASAAGLP